MKLNLLAGALGVSLIFSTPFAEALTTTEIVQLDIFLPPRRPDLIIVFDRTDRLFILALIRSQP
jgi:hypothetical protein